MFQVSRNKKKQKKKHQETQKNEVIKVLWQLQNFKKKFDKIFVK